MATKDRLAATLQERRLERLAKLAEAGIFDDFETPLPFPTMTLVAELRAVGAHDLAERAMDGEWEATREEADAWFQREGRDLLFPKGA